MSIARTARSALIAAAHGAASAPVVALIVAPAAAQAVPAAVSIDDFTFNPPKLTVRAGTTVSWTNKHDIPHGIAWSSNLFPRSKTLDTNNSTTFTFTTPGIYQYFCYIHPHMVGMVVVQVAMCSDEK
jgi:plastocyanin